MEGGWPVDRGWGGRPGDEGAMLTRPARVPGRKGARTINAKHSDPETHPPVGSACLSSRIRARPPKPCRPEQGLCGSVEPANGRWILVLPAQLALKVDAAPPYSGRPAVRKATLPYPTHHYAARLRPCYDT